jgi:hypothetical protein
MGTYVIEKTGNQRNGYFFGKLKGITPEQK